MQRQDDVAVERRQGLHETTECRLARIGIAVDRGEHIPASGQTEVGDSRRALGDRTKQARGVGHHIANDSHAIDDALGRQIVGTCLRGAEERGAEAVCDNAVDLLGHRAIERP